jgi:L-threonylcarbamoyladenylate synthase
MPFIFGMGIIQPTPESIQQAAAEIRTGGLVAFPTETVYGLGANAFDARAVARVFEVKRRPSFDPLIVHIPGVHALQGLVARTDERVVALARAFWPGPLTVVLPKTERIPDVVTAGLPSVAVRVPDHPVALHLLQAAGVPVAAPSANPFAYVSPTRAEHVWEQLGQQVAWILDGGPCRVGLESTVLSLLEPTPVILRPGFVDAAALQQVVGPVEVQAATQARPQAPGQLERHYATRTPVQIVESASSAHLRSGERAGLISFRAVEQPQRFVAATALSPGGDLIEAASRLFGALRAMDALKLDCIYAEAVPESGIGIAIMDRLRRCAAR